MASSTPESDKNADRNPSDNPHLEQHHVSKILDEVLDEPDPSSTQTYKHPAFLDILLGLGLVIAMGGFTVGLFKMYLTHSAEQSITQRNYKAAIAILKGAPFPGWFSIPGSDPEELLNQALYLDAMNKLEENNVNDALQEFQQIKPGSRFFNLAQQVIKEHDEPSETLLEGGAVHLEKVPPRPPKEEQLKIPGLSNEASR